MLRTTFDIHAKVLAQRFPFPKGTKGAAEWYYRRLWTEVEDHDADHFGLAVEKLCESNFSRPSVASIVSATVLAGGGTQYHDTNPDRTNYATPSEPVEERKGQWAQVMDAHRTEARPPQSARTLRRDDEHSRAALKQLEARVRAGDRNPERDRVPQPIDPTLTLLDAISGRRSLDTDEPAADGARRITLEDMPGRAGTDHQERARQAYADSTRKEEPEDPNDIPF